MTAQQEYKIKKRKAVRIEELEPIQTAPLKEDNRIGEPPGLEPFTHEKYEWKQVKNKIYKPKLCIWCGHAAEFWAYFKIDKKGTLLKEKYYPQCLDKWVYLPSSAELSGDTCYSCK